MDHRERNSASGIGKVIAAEFVRNGTKVIVADLQDNIGHSIAVEVGPSVCCYTHCDVTDEAQPRRSPRPSTSQWRATAASTSW
ncbi:hypothetical protein HU200_035976 [Digitaria exilis]|uniref:Uncharacterized protein n=1 Tax=Digitaria exilis TaxID=1010633 RepID=A0A835BH64_9POAL|nr:hypothetical protein HU200_035976 [Digitaria exilis]